MLAAVLHSYDDDFSGLRLEERPVLQPGPGEVQIKIAASPLNPSDLLFVRGLYARKTLPVVAGFEGSGTITAVGEGVNAQRWLNRRVSCFASETDGTWAEYMVTKASAVVAVNDDLSDEQAATLLVNPLTAWALLNMAQRDGVTAVVQTAATSSVGKMIIRLAQRLNIKTINIVRRDEQIEELKAIGAEHVLNSSSKDFGPQLFRLCKIHNARMAFDAVGGELTGKVLFALPSGSRLTVYGNLSEQPANIPVDQLVFRRKVLDGFWLSTWLPDQGAERLAAAFKEVQSLIVNELQSTIRARYGLSQIGEALVAYRHQMGGGKVLILPGTR